jgi:hypothetical protein
MIKKSVSIKSKDPDTVTELKQARGRPKSRMIDNDIVQKLPSSRVFTVSIENKPNSMVRANNIIRLKLKISNINKLERYINVDNKGLLGTETSVGVVDWSTDVQCEQWDTAVEEVKVQVQVQVQVPVKPEDQEPLLQDHSKGNVKAASALTTSTKTQANNKTQAKSTDKEQAQEPRSGLESFIKIRSLTQSVEEKPLPNRKDLIINSGIKRTSQEPLQVFSDSWPMTSPYACWYCCHTFETTPVGIPSILTNYVFRCYGNFCSYNCAKRYLCPLKDDEDDMASMQSSNDLFKGDDQGEKLQLLELLYHLETNADLDEPIKTSPRRLILRMFGGTKTIEEFRDSFKTNTTYHTFKMPLASMAYHMEECVDTKSETRRKFKNMSLDVARLEQAYEELMKERRKATSIQKILDSF